MRPGLCFSLGAAAKEREKSVPQKVKQPALVRLKREDLPAGTVELARFLIGRVVVREIGRTRLSGRIVETEAYPPGDPAAHHFRGPTPRNRAMYLGPGHAYVYFSYGNHFMLNVTAEEPGIPGGILIRAMEPLEGLRVMEKNRGTTRLLDLARGPGRLAQALRIDRRLDSVDLCARGPLWLGEIRGAGAASIGTSVRIGITKGAASVWRFYESGSPFLSGTRKLNLGTAGEDAELRKSRKR